MLAIFYVHGSVGNRPMDFLLDSGATIPVIHQKALPDHINITDATTATISANGAPLVVTGKVILTVTLCLLSVT